MSILLVIGVIEHVISWQLSRLPSVTQGHIVRKQENMGRFDRLETIAMKVCVTGSTGMVGEALITRLKSQQHEIVRLVRSEPKADEIRWSPAKSEIDSVSLEGIDAVVHLAGENIAEGRWNDAKKKRIRDSRVDATSLLANALAGLNRPPQCFVSASATGYYGDRGDEELTESSEPGTGFLPDVCVGWENSAKSAAEAGIRVTHPRIGVVLSKKGGALPKMLTPFKMGVGGKVGSGKQYWSWITLPDLVGAIEHALDSELTGPFNAVSPNPCTNIEFTKALGKALGRPAIFPMPAFMAKLALGEMAEDLILASARVLPTELERTGFKFQHPKIEEALQAVVSE